MTSLIEYYYKEYKTKKNEIIAFIEQAKKRGLNKNEIELEAWEKFEPPPNFPQSPPPTCPKYATKYATTTATICTYNFYTKKEWRV